MAYDIKVLLWSKRRSINQTHVLMVKLHCIHAGWWALPLQSRMVIL